MQIETNLKLSLPFWVTQIKPDTGFHDIRQRMLFVINLARQNINEKTGGPFAAAVFNLSNYSLISIGVNIVEPACCSSAHAEILALSLAQKKSQNHDLGQISSEGCELVTSVEPCAMCLGAIPWSGIKSLVCGARGEDACSIGFNEGQKPSNWQEGLEQRGISVKLDICRDESAKALRDYAENGGLIYNAND